MTYHDPIHPPPTRWAPWEGDGVTLHLARDVEPDNAIHGIGACAAYGVLGRLAGPPLDLTQARTLADWRAHGYRPVCSHCAEIALAELPVETEARVRTYLAYEIRADLVCCDSFDVCRPEAAREHVSPVANPHYHDLCYWGEAIARHVADPDEDDQCDHTAGSWFDRTVCPSPCDAMHDRCYTCGAALDPCGNRYASYYESVPEWVRRRAQARYEPRHTPTSTPTPALTADRVREATAELKTRTDPRLTRLLEELAKLRERNLWLTALENAGVDNWDGYDYACDLLREYEREDREDQEDQETSGE